MKKIVALFISVSLLACASPERAVVAPIELISIASVDTLDHLGYIGSDEYYHYIDRNKMFNHTLYKVQKETLFLKKTFPLNQGGYYVLWPDMIKDGLKKSMIIESSLNERVE